MEEEVVEGIRVEVGIAEAVVTVGLYEDPRLVR